MIWLQLPWKFYSLNRSIYQPCVLFPYQKFWAPEVVQTSQKHIFSWCLSKFVVSNPNQIQYISYFYSVSSISIPSNNYFKPLGHSSNLLLYPLFPADKNTSKTALNSQVPLRLNNLSTVTFVLSYLYLSRGRNVPPSTWSLILVLPEPYPSVKPQLLYSFNFCSSLAASFWLSICSHLFHVKMLTSLSLQSTFSKYWHVSHHHRSFHKGIIQ